MTRTISKEDMVRAMWLDRDAFDWLWFKLHTEREYLKDEGDTDSMHWKLLNKCLDALNGKRYMEMENTLELMMDNLGVAKPLEKEE